MKKRKTKRLSVAMFVCMVGIAIAFANFIVANAEQTKTIREQYGTYIDEIAEPYSICPELLEAMIEHESSGQADVVSSAGCVGLMQVSPKWHADRIKRLGVTDLYDPYSNILVATDYLAELFAEYEDLPMVLMTYNGSSDAQERWESGNFTDYAKDVMERSAELEREHEK